MTNRPRLLAVTYGGGHVAMMLPVLRALQEQRPGLDIHLLALTTARAAAAEFVDRAFGFAELLARWPDAEAQHHGERLAAGNTHPGVDLHESIAYLGLNWMDLVREHGAGEAARRYAEAGRGAFHPMHTLRRLVAELRPDFVLTTNSPRAEQAAIEAAVAAEIPSLAMFDLFPVEQDPYAARPVIADRTTVISSTARDTLLRAGLAPASVEITGNPAFDSLATPAHAHAAQALRERLGWQGLWVVLYAGYAEPAANARWPAGTAFPLAIEERLRGWVDTQPAAALIVRQHPNNWHLFRDAWAARPQHPRVHISLPGDEPVESVILASHAVVVQVSTVGVQGAVAGKAVFSMEESPSTSYAGFSWGKLGIAVGIDNLDNLPAALELARIQRQAARLAIPSPAAPRIAELVLRAFQSAAGS